MSGRKGGNSSQRLPEPEFLANVGYWFADSLEAKAHAASFTKFLERRLITVVEHTATNGFAAHRYEITEAGLSRLRELTSDDVAERAQHHRDYMRRQAGERVRRQKLDQRSTF